MKTAIIYDCEYVCMEGSQRRIWSGVQDPDPVIAQIGAVKLGLEGDFPILDTFGAYVIPMDRHGNPFALDPYFSQLTGITEGNIRDGGISLQDALTAVDHFSGGAGFWSWGKDELYMLAISCYVAGIPAPIPAHRFDNAAKLLLAAGMPDEVLVRTSSNQLADYYGVAHPPLLAHDARDDALSVAYALQHLLRTGKLAIEAFSNINSLA